jgi:class 3 adenylate cyclase
VADLPSGTVTFLFTDIEGSTRHWEERPEAMSEALARHDAILDEAIASHGGVVFSRMGDGMAAAFSSPDDAIAATLDAQLKLTEETWPTETGPLRVRMGLHTGQGVLVEGQYLNQPLNRCARLMAIGHGGQDIERALQAIIDEAVAKRATLVEIIPGKGSGQLKKRVLRFLDQKEIKAQYQRVEKDSRNFGRVFVHFRWK